MDDDFADLRAALAALESDPHSQKIRIRHVGTLVFDDVRRALAALDAAEARAREAEGELAAFKLRVATGKDYHLVSTIEIKAGDIRAVVAAIDAAQARVRRLEDLLREAADCLVTEEYGEMSAATHLFCAGCGNTGDRLFPIKHAHDCTLMKARAALADGADKGVERG